MSTKNVAYFEFEVARKKITANKKNNRYLYLSTLLGSAAIIYVWQYTQYNTLQFVIIYAALLCIIYITTNNLENISNRNNNEIVKNRSLDRKHFAKINNLNYERRVVLESDLQYANDDEFALHYIAGEINGITFWNADTKYTYVTEDTKHTELIKQNATAVFTENELPKIYIIDHLTLVGEKYDKYIPIKTNILKISQQFDKKYTVFVPKNYERDALYFLTPELLEIILKYEPMIIEIEKQRIIIHKYGAIETKKDYDMLAEMIQELGAEFIENTLRYQDNRSKVKNKIHKSGTVVKI